MNAQLQSVKIDVTRQLAEYAVNLKEQEVTEEALHAAKRCLLDWIGVALGGSASKGADILVKLADQLGGARTVNVIGRERKTDPLHAALINGFMAHVMDYDDTHLDSMLHPSAPIWPAVPGSTGRIDGTNAGQRISSVWLPSASGGGSSPSSSPVQASGGGSALLHRSFT